MTASLHDRRFPGESSEYRNARNALLEAEMALREQLENVAQLRRQLPDGGLIKENYVFDELYNGEVREVDFTSLFEVGKNTLIVYSFMFGPEQEKPCMMCNSFLDGMDGNVEHLEQKINFAVVARAPVEKINKWAERRGWSRLRLLSSVSNNYNADYFGEDIEGHQWPACNVFVKREDGVHHYYATELLFAPSPGQPRHMDLNWPLWNMLDLTPEGREDFVPRLSYEKSEMGG